MDIVFQAFRDAAPVWEQAMRQSSWYHAFIAAAYLGAAWLVFLNGYIARQARQAHLIWYLAAAAMFVLGVNTVLHGDVLVTHVLRALAKLQGWYGGRRALQYLMLGAAALAVLSAARWLRGRFAACDVSSEPVAFGLLAVLMLFVVRAVSAHGTDAMLNLRLAGVSLGRLLEFAGVGLVVHGALRCLRLR
jgi:hypothetical protein